MYRWIVFLHVFSAFVYILAHGVQAAVMLKLRSEADPERSLMLFNALDGTRLQRYTLALVVVTGLIAGFMGRYWGRGWMWTALVLLVVIAVVMRRYGSGYYDLVEGAANRAIAEQKSQASLEAFAVARAAWRPVGVTEIGIGGLAAMIWLMMFKPF